MATNPDQNGGLELVEGPRIIVPAAVLSTDAAVLGYGDAVKVATMAAESNGIMTVTRANNGDAIIGVVINPRVKGWKYTDTDRRRPASTASLIHILLVQPGQGHVFRIQASAGTDLSTTLTSATRFCDLATVADADSVTAQSTSEADLSTLHATDGQLYVLGVDTTYGDTNLAGQDNTKILVRIANT